MTDTLSVHIEELGDKSHNVRGRAALALGTSANARAADALIRALRVERDPFVRENITWALVRVGGGVVPRLIDLLRDADASVRHHASHVLGKFADPSAVGALIEALADTDAAVVAKTALALGRIGDARAIPGLVRLVGHPSRDVESTLASVLEGFGAPAVPALVEALDSGSWQIRAQAAQILGLIGHADALAALSRRLSDSHWQIRFAALHAVSAIDGAHARLAAAALEDDPDARVRDLVKRIRPKGAHHD